MSVTERRGERDRILSALHQYTDFGLPIIPVCSHDHKGYSEKHIARCSKAGKVPLIKDWQTHASTTKDQLKSWIREFRNINIGLPLGHISGYVGIDVDGEFGEDLLEDLSRGDLPDTWEFTTGDGRRLLYAIPVGMQTKKSVNVADGEHQECSILAFGQQTVLPPSIHYTGRTYEWVEDHSPDDIDCAMAPDWLLNLVRVDEHRKQAAGTIDLTQDIPQAYVGVPAKASNVVEVKPLIITDGILPSEFTSYEEMEMDLIPPDTGYAGKEVKEQEQEQEDQGVTEQELMQRITAGGRDNQMTRIIGSFCARFRALGKDYIMLMAKNHNRMFCEPPLDELSIEAKVNHFWETEQMKSSRYKGLSADGEEKKQFSPSIIAQAAINILEDSGKCLKADSENPIIWMTDKTAGPWVPINANSGNFQLHLKEPISNPELGGDSRWTTIRHYKDVTNSVVIELRSQFRTWDTDSKNRDTQTLDAYKYIPLHGGKLLDWKTGEVLPWDPETNLTYVLPIEYDPNAKAPAWERRLKEWLPDEGSRLILQEFIGYSLIPYMGFEKALVIQGEGANGKSLFLETIQGLLGYDVVDSIDMRNLFSRFGQADLVGKILNIVNEAGSEYLRGAHADTFKNLVSGGRIKADVKNQSPLTFNNTAKFIFASNHDVKTGDKSEGWLRRMLIVPFDQDFRDSKVPKFEIMQELKKEHAGIFNWAIDGLRRLMEQQQFSDSESAQKKKLSYIRENDIAADFFMNCLETFDITVADAEGKVRRSGTPSAVINNLFGVWIDYRESSVQKKTENITKYLEKKHALVKQRTTHILFLSKTMTECWIGLRINIRDAGFLEHLLGTDSYVKFNEIKDYAQKRLNEIDKSNYTTQQNVKDFPNSQAQ